MNYLKLGILLSGFALFGVSCNLFQGPTSVSDTDDSAVEGVMDENEKLRMEKEELIEEMKAMEEKMDSKDEEDSMMDDDETMEEDAMTEDNGEFKFNEREGGLQVINPVSLKAGENSIVVFLSADLNAYTNEDRYAAFGCRDVLVPVEVELEKEMSDLAHALVELLTIKKTAYEDRGLENTVAGFGFTLENVSYEDGTRIIDFAGEPSDLGVCQLNRVRYQIEETVGLYSDDYEIRLDGSASAWDDVFSGVNA